MVSLETEADRTLFFDLLPLEVGTIGGMRVRLQLYTVPGQVFYNTTRKLVLKGVDGIVFVADSQEPALEANIESFHNLKRNLEELNQPIGKIPFIFQYNKRDLRNILSVDALNRQLNHEGFDAFEGAALHGVGVFETLKSISKKTLAAVHRKISGDSAAPVLVGSLGEVSVEEETETSETAELRSPSSTPVVEVAEEPGTSDELFAELEDELDPEAVAITEGAGEEKKKLGPEASTAEVKVEFAANPEVTQDLDAVEVKAAVRGKKVATQSMPDIERELASLREMAFGAGPAKKDKKAEASTTVFAQGEGKAEVPWAVLEKVSGMLVDLKLVGDGGNHFVPGAIKVELPAIERGARAKVRLEIELVEGGEDE
jgi:signal recognition particle receptor subunit beta